MNAFSFLKSCYSLKIVTLTYAILLIAVVIPNIVLAKDDDSKTPQIINGALANYGLTPYMVSLQVLSNGRYHHTCGGSVIEDRFVLTAAHCVAEASLGGLYVYQGNGNLGFGGSHFKVERVFQHESYQSPRPFENDIALLYVPNLYGIEIVQLASEGYMSQMFLNTEVQLVGWGHYNRSNASPADLLFGRFYFLPAADCQAYYFNDAFSWGGTQVDFRWITEKNVCAGVNSFFGQQPCHGDSGGPLMRPDGSRYVQVGITSFGEPNKPSIGLLGCGLNGEPAVFTRVASFIPWISRTITDFYNQQNSGGSNAGNDTNSGGSESAGEADSAGVIRIGYILFVALAFIGRCRKL